MLLPIAARVKSLQVRHTNLGSRIYAVFKIDDDREVGVWAPVDQQPLASLSVGDQAFFKQDSYGSLHLLPKPPFIKRMLLLAQPLTLSRRESSL
jgi:hypothetical protein